jgi:hypothetical protein
LSCKAGSKEIGPRCLCPPRDLVSELNQ